MASSIPTVGIVSPPGWYDPTADELKDLVNSTVRFQQMILPSPNLQFDDLANVAAEEENLVLCSQMLGRAGADVVAMTGTPFAWAGLRDEPSIRARQARLAEAANRPAVMAGTAIVDALRRLGARKIAIAAPYYTTTWKDHARQVFSAFDFDVLTLMATDDAGLTGPLLSIDDYVASTHPDAFSSTIDAVHAAAPDADAIALLGAGVRTLSRQNAFEDKYDKPFVAADTALMWGICDTLGLQVKESHLGSLGKLLA